MHKSKLSTCIAAASVAAVASTFSLQSSAAIPEYFQSFDGLETANPGDPIADVALDDDGWLIYAAVFDGTTTPDASGNSTYPGVFQFQYGFFDSIATPNGGAGFSAVVDDTTNKFLNAYSDYNCCDLGELTPLGHGDAVGPTFDVVQAQVMHEYSVEAGDVGKTLSFRFVARLPDVDASGNEVAVGIGCTEPCTAFAFVKTLDPGASYATTNNIEEDMGTQAIKGDWTEFTIQLPIDVGLDGQILQVGFGSLTSQFENSGVYYDNVCITTQNDVSAACVGPAEATNVPVPAFAVAIFAGLCAGIGALVRRRVR